MNRLFKWIGIIECPVLLALISIMHYNMNNVIWSWLFGMVCAGRLLVNIAKDAQDV